jgi:hypothetical protein
MAFTGEDNSMQSPCALPGVLHLLLLFMLMLMSALLLLLLCSAAPHAGAHAAPDPQAADDARQHGQHQALPVTTHGEPLAVILNYARMYGAPFAPCVVLRVRMLLV